MNNESALPEESRDRGNAGDPTPKSPLQAWVSILTCIASIAIFLGLMVENNYESWETLSRFGYLPADAIWNGGYWALVTSAFVHFEIWHLAFNVYWLWVLGSRLENAIGSLPFLAFFLVAAIVSSSFQLAASDSTGIGASGVVYAIFGFMWLARHRYPHFKEVLDTRTIQLFVIWLGGCILATYLKVWEVGNAAHISGLLFGCAVAGAFILPYKPRLVFVGLFAFVVSSLVPLIWCPWSVVWLSKKAYEAHSAERYDIAIELYKDVIERDPDNSWAYLNRGYAYQALGYNTKADADLQKSREIDQMVEDTR